VPLNSQLVYPSARIPCRAHASPGTAQTTYSACAEAHPRHRLPLSSSPLGQMSVAPELLAPCNIPYCLTSFTQLTHQPCPRTACRAPCCPHQVCMVPPTSCVPLQMHLLFHLTLAPARLSMRSCTSISPLSHIRTFTTISPISQRSSSSMPRPFRAPTMYRISSLSCV